MLGCAENESVDKHATFFMKDHQGEKALKHTHTQSCNE